MPQGNQMDIKTLSLSVAAVAANSRKSGSASIWVVINYYKV